MLALSEYLEEAREFLLQNTAFSRVSQFLQLAWDSHSLGLLKECPRKYFLSIILGWQPREMNVHLTFGLLYHAALEKYDHMRTVGASHNEALHEAVKLALVQTRIRTADGGWRPWNSGDNNKNRFTLVRSIIWYLDKFENDTLKTIQLSDGTPAVELSFRFETDYETVNGEKFILCGHMDRLVDLDGTSYTLDRKTTKSTINDDWFSKFSPDNQFSLYSLAGKVVWSVPTQGVIVDGAQIAVGFSRFKRGFAPRTDSQLTEWYADTGYWLGQAEMFAAKQYWPMNDKSCGNYGGCPFRNVCGKSPEVRDMWLKSKFHKRQWDPLQVRGDI